jgi:hypothetical protein
LKEYPIGRRLAQIRREHVTAPGDQSRRRELERVLGGFFNLEVEICCAVLNFCLEILRRHFNP